MPSTLNLPLQAAASANDTSPEAFKWNSLGAGTLHVRATTWDGATVTIQGTTDDGTTWDTVADGTFTADAIVAFEAGQIGVRAQISGVGGSTDAISVTLVPQGR